MTKNVLILDANQRSALAVVRSLGKHNISIYTTDNTPSSLAGSSRFAIQHFYLPSALDSVNQFVEELSRLIHTQQIDVLFPMTDTSIQAVLLNKSRLPTIKLPYPDYAQYDSVSNKASLFKYAEQTGIHTPQTFYVEDIGTIPDILKSVNCRLVIKPYKSKIYMENKVFPTQVFLPASNTQIPELVQQYDWLKQHPFMLQEYISGYGKGLFAIYNQGTPIAYFSHKRIHEKPPQGGVSVVCRSEPVSEDLIQIADKLLRAKKWHGVAMIELKIDASGKAYLMEINARFWGSLQLAIDSGIDFPWLLYQIATGELDKPLNVQYKKSVLRWLLGDFDRLYIVLKSSTTQYSVAKKIFEILKFTIPYYPGMRYEIIRLNDIKPFIYELREYFKQLFQRNKV